MTDVDFTPGEERPVIVAHNGVHQAFQIALAAEEAGLLDPGYGSVVDASGSTTAAV